MSLKKILFTFVILTVLFSSTVFSNVKAKTIDFTPEEQEYIKEKETVSIMMYTSKGNVPIQYEDKNGNIKGITIEVLDHIEKITGFTFEYDTCQSIECAIKKGGDLYTPLSNKHEVKNLIPSETFASVSSSAFMNKHNPLNTKNDFKGKRYAEIIKRNPENLPSSVEVVYYETREDTIKAVNNGEADFGIGNDFSLTHYIYQDYYDDIITIPLPNSVNEYTFGFINQDELFMSIINKAIKDMSQEEMQTIIYSLIYQDIDSGTLTRFINKYNDNIIVFFAVLSVVFIWMIYKLIKARKQIFIENQHYTILAKNSNELLFEHKLSSDDVIYWGSNTILEDKFEQELIRNQIIFEIESHLDLEEQIIKIFDVNGVPYHIRIKKSVIYNQRNNPVSVFGSMSDISEEREYVELLELQSRTDSLTNLSNSRYLKEVIAKRLEDKQPFVKDAFILFDLDNFKMVNDSFGHLEGDKVLIESAKIIKEVFDDALVVARFGGDEFSVYVNNVFSELEIEKKTLKIIEKIKNMKVSINIGITAGITFIVEQENFDIIFKEADDALYLGKKDNQKNMIIYQNECK